MSDGSGVLLLLATRETYRQMSILLAFNDVSDSLINAQKGVLQTLFMINKAGGNFTTRCSKGHRNNGEDQSTVTTFV